MSSELLQLNALLDELKSREAHPFESYKPNESPQCNQLAFHKSDKWCRLLIGGNRSGKSRAGAQEVLWYLTETHPYLTTPKAPRIWVISTEYRTIFEGVYSHLKNSLPEWYIKRKGPKIPGWDMPSFIEAKQGGRIDFISAQGGEADRKKVQSAEIDLLEIDEEIGSDLNDELQMRLLSRGGKMMLTLTMVNSEPWICDLEDEALAGSDDVALFRLDTRFNSHNDPKALARIMSKMSPEAQEIRIQGKRRRVMGLVYPSFDPATHLVRPFKIPADWTRIMVYDPGFRVSAGIWWAISPQGKAYIYREMYLKGADMHQVAEHFYRVEGHDFVQDQWIPNENYEPIKFRIIDKSAFHTQTDGTVGIAIRMQQDHDLIFSPSISDKPQNVEDVRRLLMLAPDGKPGLFIFDDCQNFQNEIKRYQLKADTSKRGGDESADRPLKKHDHLMNCMEYAASQRMTYMHHRTEREKLYHDARKHDSQIDFPSDPQEFRNYRHRLRRARSEIQKGRTPFKRRLNR